MKLRSIGLNLAECGMDADDLQEQLENQYPDYKGLIHVALGTFPHELIVEVQTITAASTILSYLRSSSSFDV